MLKLRLLLIAAGLALAGLAPTLAASPTVGPIGIDPPQSMVQTVQYGYGRDRDLCGNWHRECARLYGHQTNRWHQCMAQPLAIADCGGGRRESYRDQRGNHGERYERGSRDQCHVWRRECAKFHGWQTEAWHACMGQPRAVYDCGGGGRHR